MRKLAILVLMSWLAATTGSFAAKLVGISADTGNVYIIDTADPGNPAFKFTLGAGKDFAGLAYSPVRRTYFVFSRFENKIYEFNTKGKVLTTITPNITFPKTNRGIVFDQFGNLHMLGVNNNVYQINLTTGATKFKFQATGPTSEVESLAPLDNHAFLGVGVRSQILVVERSSGQMTSIASLPVGDLDSMTGTIGGWIYMSESGSNSLLHAYNPYTQTYQSLSWTNISHLSSLEESWPNAK